MASETETKDEVPSGMERDVVGTGAGGTFAFSRGDLVVLYEDSVGGEAPRRHLLTLDGKTSKVAGLGIVNAANLEGLPEGGVYALGSRSLRVFRPSLPDLVETVRRKAQIVLPKDAAQIIFQAGIGPGCRVVEAGIGSGALTIALAHAVGPNGHVYNYEIREDFQGVGRGNLERVGLLARVTLSLGDVAEGIRETALDAGVFDLPEPWRVVGPARGALRPGGIFVAYTPSVGQMERTFRALVDGGFLDVRSQEVLVRGWHVGEKGVRPRFEMLGHTAWLTFARNPGPHVTDG